MAAVAHAATATNARAMTPRGERIISWALMERTVSIEQQNAVTTALCIVRSAALSRGEFLAITELTHYTLLLIFGRDLETAAGFRHQIATGCDRCGEILAEQTLYHSAGGGVFGRQRGERTAGAA